MVTIRLRCASAVILELKNYDETKKKKEKNGQTFLFFSFVRALRFAQCLIRSLLFSQKAFVFEEKEKKTREERNHS